MTYRVTIAESDKCREPSLIERIGATAGTKLADSRLRSWMKAAYHCALNLRSGGKGLTCSLPDGEKVRILPARRYVSWNIGEYRAFKKALKPGGIALDIGANVGCYSLLFGQWAGPTGKVFSFEPAPGTFTDLCRHIELNNLGATVMPIQAALSDTCATASFLALDNQGMSRLAAQDEAQSQVQVVDVPTVTVDEFCARENILPDLIKIDVEGFEMAVLRGARATIKACGERAALFVEMHPTTWREIGLTKDEIIEELELQNLKALPLGACDDMWALEGECLRLVAK